MRTNGPSGPFLPQIAHPLKPAEIRHCPPRPANPCGKLVASRFDLMAILLPMSDPLLGQQWVTGVDGLRAG